MANPSPAADEVVKADDVKVEELKVFRPEPNGANPNSAAIDKFLRENPAVDDRAGATLRNAPPHVQLAVLERGNLTDCNNASATLMTRIKSHSGGHLASSGLSPQELEGDPAEAWAKICAKNNIGSGGQSSHTADPMALAQQQMAATHDWCTQQSVAFLQLQQQQDLTQQLMLLQYQQQQQMAAMIQPPAGLLPQGVPPVVGADVLGGTAQIAPPPLPPMPPQVALEQSPSGLQENQALTLPPQGFPAPHAPPPPPPPPPQPASQAVASGMHINPPPHVPPPPAMPWAGASSAGYGGGSQVGGYAASAYAERGNERAGPY